MLERVGSPDVVIFVLQEAPNVIVGKEFIIQRKVIEDGDGSGVELCNEM